MHRRHALGLMLGAAAAPALAGGHSHAAFVVGVSQYDAARALTTPVSDARTIASVLRGLGYRTVLRTDPTREALIEDLFRFRSLARNAELIVVYLAGHGIQIAGETFFLPKDADTSGQAIWESAISVQEIARTLSDQLRNKVFFVDTCRDQIAAAGPPPQQSSPVAGVHATFATQPGQVALDNVGGQSPFAASLIHALHARVLPVEEVARVVRLHTMRATQGQQVPWSMSTLMTEVHLSPGATPIAPSG